MMPIACSDIYSKQMANVSENEGAQTEIEGEL